MHQITIKEDQKYKNQYLVRIGDALFSMNQEAASPRGINMYLEEVKSDVFNKEEFNKLTTINFTDAPQRVQKAIKQRVNQFKNEN